MPTHEPPAEQPDPAQEPVRPSQPEIPARQDQPAPDRDAPDDPAPEPDDSDDDADLPSHKRNEPRLDSDPPAEDSPDTGESGDQEGTDPQQPATDGQQGTPDASPRLNGSKTLNTDHYDSNGNHVHGRHKGGGKISKKSKERAREENEHEHGQLECDYCGTHCEPSKKSASGVPAPPNAAQYNHRWPKSKGGNNCPDCKYLFSWCERGW